MITVSADTFRLARTFTIARGSKTEARVLTVRILRAGVAGWGECVPYARYGETLDSVAAQIESLPEGISRQDLQAALGYAAGHQAENAHRRQANGIRNHPTNACSQIMYHLAGVLAGMV